MYSSEQLDLIYTILVEHCDADKSISRASFIKEHLSEDFPSELRICPKLNWGGKFWRNNGRLYVSQYPEIATTETIEIAKTVNKLLEPFYTKTLK